MRFRTLRSSGKRHLIFQIKEDIKISGQRCQNSVSCNVQSEFFAELTHVRIARIEIYVHQNGGICYDLFFSYGVDKWLRNHFGFHSFHAETVHVVPELDQILVRL